MKQIKRAKKILGHKALRGLFLISFAGLSMGGYLTAQAQGAIPMSQAGGADLRQGGAIQLFHKIKKPDGETAGWLIGNHHHVCVERDSFPIEINQAMDQADIGLIELASSQNNLQNLLSDALVYLPEGITIASLIGEQKAREIFEYISRRFSQEESIKILFQTVSIRLSITDATPFDITSYIDFNSLLPDIILSHLVLVATFDQSDESMRAHILKRAESVIIENEERISSSLADCSIPLRDKNDSYIESYFNCSERPFHSIETAASQSIDISSGFSYQDKAEQLAQNFDAMSGGSLNEGSAMRPSPDSASVNSAEKFVESNPEDENSMESLFPQLNTIIYSFMVFFKEPIARQRLYNTDLTGAFNNKVLELSHFLNENQCRDFSESDTRALVNKIFEFEQFRLEFRSSGLEMDQATEAHFRRLSRELIQLKNNIFTSCFPDFSLPEGLEEIQREAISTQIEAIKKEHHGLIIVRDPKIAQGIISHLGDGEVFAAIGAAHLNGVIRHLSEAGFVVEPVALSQPWNILDDSACDNNPEQDEG